MIADWALWVTVLIVGGGVAIVSSYLLCNARIEQMNNRLRLLERQISLARNQEDLRAEKLDKIFEAISVLQQTTEDQLRSLRERIDEMIAEGPGIGSR